jgi:hypothetical protein
VITRLAVARQLVRKAKLDGHAPRLHPNGFVQLDVALNTRLHVWPANILSAQKTRHPIHDHPFDLKSTILRGSITNVLYSIEPCELRVAPEEEERRYVLHRVKTIGGNDTILEPTAGQYFLRNIDVDRTNAGKYYRMAKYVLHDSFAITPCVTLMEKLNIDRDYRPLVAVPADIKPDNDFRRASNIDFLWHTIDNALED